MHRPLRAVSRKSAPVLFQKFVPTRSIESITSIRLAPLILGRDRLIGRGCGPGKEHRESVRVLSFRPGEFGLLYRVVGVFATTFSQNAHYLSAMPYEDLILFLVAGCVTEL